MAPPFHTDHVGSLIRPQRLLDARAEAAKDPSSSEARSRVKTEEENAIKEVVSTQISKGVVPITSGEFERDIFYGGIFEKLSGFESTFKDWSQHRPGLPTATRLQQFGLKGREAPVATAKVGHEKGVYLDDWLFLRSLLPEDKWSQAKMTIPSPVWIYVQLRDGEEYTTGVYESDAAFLADVSAAFRKEILVLYEHGLRFVQVDDPNLTYFCDVSFIEASENENTDLNTVLQQCIKAHNDMIRDLPEDLHIGIHLCRGNMTQGQYFASGGYERIAAELFNSLNYRLFYLEFDSPRAGDFTPLRRLPVGKAVVLGIATTKHAELEDEDELRDRVHRAADVIAEGQARGREDVLSDTLAVSPQCGFASSSGNKGVGFAVETQWQKLELLKNLASRIWPSAR
ncbi:hypothetical protein H2203_002093 [Taxawa tesnikishii (nom. ined.)]|nr:hypothetical protein H2203_002093 [Dothideales sp. JES 119]